ncbi:secondary carrier transporter [Lithospermum erythrorhizon]|uniref:Secondary carrier transporter n=1 Tax=Lithospermum erythrorhizon TaxID=34254 RepID=A0AAV3QUA7_LITER
MNFLQVSLTILSSTIVIMAGLFIALQDKFISCGVYMTLFALVLRFVVGPLTMTIGSVAMGLHGDVLHVSILQAALPQAFVFSKEYGLHATVLSTAVIFGTLLSVPILIAYFAILEVLH